MSNKIIAIVFLVVLIIVYYAYTQGLFSGQPVYMQSPDKVCGANYGSQPGSAASLDCMRSMWLDAKCTDQGSVWKNALDPSVPADKAVPQLNWWLNRPRISDIQDDIKLYYSHAKAGNPGHMTSCGI